jgi:hypothetical protein
MNESSMNFEKYNIFTKNYIFYIKKTLNCATSHKTNKNTLLNRDRKLSIDVEFNLNFNILSLLLFNFMF